MQELPRLCNGELGYYKHPQRQQKGKVTVGRGAGTQGKVSKAVLRLRMAIQRVERLRKVRGMAGEGEVIARQSKLKV